MQVPGIIRLGCKRNETKDDLHNVPSIICSFSFCLSCALAPAVGLLVPNNYYYYIKGARTRVTRHCVSRAAAEVHTTYDLQKYT